MVGFLCFSIPQTICRCCLMPLITTCSVFLVQMPVLLSSLGPRSFVPFRYVDSSGISEEEPTVCVCRCVCVVFCLNYVEQRVWSEFVFIFSVTQGQGFEKPSIWLT